MNPTALRVISATFAFALVYAMFRYHLFEAVPMRDFALYVFNKVLALWGFVLLAISFSLQPARSLGVRVPDRWLAARKEIGITAFMVILAHTLCSMLTFGSGAYYGKFFTDQHSLTAIGSWSMLLGIMSFVWLWVYNISFKAPQEGDKALLELISSKASLTLVGLLAAGHVTVMGFKGWLSPENWAGHMPPITLVAFAVYLVSLAVGQMGRNQAAE